MRFPERLNDQRCWASNLLFAQRLDQRLQLLQPTDLGGKVLDLHDRSQCIDRARRFGHFGHSLFGFHFAGIFSVHCAFDQIEEGVTNLDAFFGQGSHRLSARDRRIRSQDDSDFFGLVDAVLILRHLGISRRWLMGLLGFYCLEMLFQLDRTKVHSGMCAAIDDPLCAILLYP